MYKLVSYTLSLSYSLRDVYYCNNVHKLGGLGENAKLYLIISDLANCEHYLHFYTHLNSQGAYPRPQAYTQFFNHALRVEESGLQAAFVALLVGIGMTDKAFGVVGFLEDL